MKNVYCDFGHLWFLTTLSVQKMMDRQKRSAVVLHYSLMYRFWVLSFLCPVCAIFGDKQSLKGADHFNLLVWCNLLTGDIPNITKFPDFLNMYAITGFCGIKRITNPMWFGIHNVTIIACKIVDLTIHQIMRFAIIMLWLMLCVPEFNPIELDWNTILQRMQTIPL